jgi:hypothetical protein
MRGKLKSRLLARVEAVADLDGRHRTFAGLTLGFILMKSVHMG